MISFLKTCTLFFLTFFVNFTVYSFSDSVSWRDTLGENFNYSTYNIWVNWEEKEFVSLFYLEQFPCRAVQGKTSIVMERGGSIDNAKFTMECVLRPNSITLGYSLSRGRHENYSLAEGIIVCPVIPKDFKNNNRSDNFYIQLDKCSQFDLDKFVNDNPNGQL
ncbi:MAG: hypothetical protein JJV93_03240 [Alphaproteobacteria bacterium]|nr:hypothetical protein [Alphaproteobacteria bacterium]